MPAQRLSMRQVREVLRLKWAGGLSDRKIAHSLSVSRPTVAEYVRRAQAVGLSWPLPATLDEAALERLLSGVAAVAGFLTDHASYLDLSIRAGFGWASGADDGRGEQRTVWTAGLDMIAAGVEAAVADGDVPDIRPRVAAGMVVSALQVWLSDWVASGRDRPPEGVIDELVLRVRWLLVGPPA